jgi:RNA polymerase sigma-70 factor (ECF subfamily)
VESAETRFAELMKTYGPALGRVVASYARPSDQDDLAQDIAIALWNALPLFRGDCSERAFVFRVAHNRALTHVARRRVRGEELPETIVDGTPTPEARASDRQQIDRLFAAIRRLSVAYRQVLTMALEDMDHAEIGACLGISVANVAVRLNRARAALRDQIEQMEEST